MSSHTIHDLRRHLFAALDGLTDKQAPMDIERAKAVAEVAQTIINSAKVEVDHLRVVGGNGSGFIGGQALPALPGVGAENSKTERRSAATVRRHILR